MITVIVKKYTYVVHISETLSKTFWFESFSESSEFPSLFVESVRSGLSQPYKKYNK